MAVIFKMEHLAAGNFYGDIPEAFPFLTKEDILACLHYATSIKENKT
jgi:uncharacterized protein (DUF433 family)